MSTEETASSRIYVAGLPPYSDDKRLREVFGERGEITDVKVLKTRDGRSRQFGFVGFQTVDQAKEAVHYFNNSYIDTHRIQVKFAEKAQSSSLERPWSAHSEGSSRFQKSKRAQADQAQGNVQGSVAKKSKTKHNAADPAAGNPELEEFLKVMQPRNKSAIWANDDAVPEAARASGSFLNSKSRGIKKASKGAVEAGEDSEEDFQDLPGPEDIGRNGRRGVQNKEPTEEPAGPRQIDAIVTDARASDMDYLKARMKGGTMNKANEAEEPDLSTEDSEADDSQDGSGDSGGSAETEVQASDLNEQHSSEAQEDLQERRDSHEQTSTSGPDRPDGARKEIARTGRLFLRNLPYQATEADLTELFHEFGELSEVHLVMDRASHKSKGFALVQFVEAADATAAFAAVDGSIFQGRLIHILPAKPVPQPQNVTEEEDGGPGVKATTFKRQKEESQKASAGNRAAWNTLFMRADTVAEAVAAHYNISKSQLLDKEAADLPVRMALGEAHVIALTKAGLAEAGVNVDAMESAAALSSRAAGEQPGVERSSTVLLVKNLPYTATEADLMETFGRAGVISKVVLPQTRTLALVEYQKSGEARQAFKALAFKRFQSVPLFLEWAPKDIFSGSPAQSAEVAKGSIDMTQQEAQPDISQLKGNDEEVESRSIYVKNLAWSTKDAGLMKHFDAVVSASGGSVRAARVAQRKGPDGKPISAGFGFVECSAENAAKHAIKKLQGSMLDGHKLALQLSMRKGVATSSARAAGGKRDANSKSTKIVVRNVAFEATGKEIRALFQPFGQIKSVRLPKKFNNSHRGFAFVDFLSHQEAVNAMASVAGTHLYGRRLVTEWAAQDEGLDELRVKTAAKFQDTAQ